MNALEKIYLLVKTLNTNDDGISTDFIRNLTGLFFIIIGEKASTNTPLSKVYHFKKVKDWHNYMDPCT